jgi:thiamine biosynthesis lipoprotein
MPNTAPQIRSARPALGTLVHIDAQAATPAQAQTAVHDAFAAIAEIERQLSYHRPDSELNRLHQHASQQPQRVSPTTWRLLQHSLALAHASAGAFDPTAIAALVRHGLRPAPPVSCPPAAAEASWADIELLPEQRQVRFRRPLWLDLGGIAKGYAVDAAITALQEAGATAGCVNAGGDLRHFGPSPQPLLVRHPGQPGELLPLGQLSAGAAATSAAYFQHPAGPRTGQPVSPLYDPRRQALPPSGLSVTVLADHCWLADGLTKVVALLGVEAAELLADYGAEAALLDASGNITASPGFWSRLGHSQPPGHT